MEINQLSFRYGERQMFNGISETFAPGITWLQGSNGRGKSTLLKILGGELKNYHGTVRIENFEANAEPLEYRSRVHLCAGEIPPFPWLKAHEFIDLMVSIYKDLDMQHLRSAIAAFGLEQFMGLSVNALSLGQYKKMQLAPALALRVKALLLDEPFNGLDASSAQYLGEALQSQQTAQKIIVLTSHQTPPMLTITATKNLDDYGSHETLTSMRNPAEKPLSNHHLRSIQ